MEKNIKFNLSNEEATVLLMGLNEVQQKAQREKRIVMDEEYHSRVFRIQAIAESLEQRLVVSFEPERLGYIGSTTEELEEHFSMHPEEL